jgi:glycosyltransferase involved in cell wall biosynthesis
MRRAFHRQFNALVAYSAQGASDFIRLGFDPARVFTAPNAVAPRPAGDPLQRPPHFRNNRAIVLYVGRLQARKNVDQLIRACALLPAHTYLQLWIVGDGPERHVLENLAQSVFPCTTFHGARHGEDLDRLFRQADLFVLPGTGGLAVQQAMSHALPVIVGQADGTQTELVRPESGWLVPGGEQALAQTLQSALSDVPHLRRMGLAAFRIVRDEVNLETMVAAFSAAVNAALEDAHARHPGR